MRVAQRAAAPLAAASAATLCVLLTACAISARRAPQPAERVPLPAVPPPPAGGSPRIMEIAANDRVLHKGGMLLVRITTSLDVTRVLLRSMGREIAVPQMSPGVFSGQEQLPSGIPSFMLNRTYQIEVVATTADGRSASFTVPVRLER